MKSNLQVMNEAFAVLKAGLVGTPITGGIYKVSRPDNSDKEDIIINALPGYKGDDGLFRCTFNVNIHVPDSEFLVDDKPESKPNFKRLKELTEAVLPLIDEKYNDSNVMLAVSQSLFPEPEIKQHYTNIRVEYISFENN